jgi:hypothetical protein
MKDLSLAGVAFASGLATLIVAGDHAAARSARTESSVESIQSRIAGDPIIAIVSLRDRAREAEAMCDHVWIFEARVEPMQAAVMQQLEKRMLVDIDRFSPEVLMKSWLAIGRRTNTELFP